MSTYAGERELQGSSVSNLLRRGLDNVLAAELHTSLEFWLYAGLLVVVLVMRFSDLGSRALHHDESLHAAFSYYFRTGKGYAHDPLMHGPFLFHITAFVYLLFGASDATSRFAPAFIGSALILMPLLLRPWLGKVGAFATAVFFAISPALLYYDRFIRNEAWVAVWTMGLFICIFCYRATARDRYLFAAAALLMLEFASKETAFMFSAILIIYLSGATAADLTSSIGERRELSPLSRAATFLVLLPVAWLAVSIWPLILRLRARWGLDEMPASGVMLLVLGLLTAPQFSAAIRIPLKKLHYNILAVPGYHVFGQEISRMQAVGGLTVIALLAITCLAGIWWDTKRWLIIAAIFYVPYFLLYTTFLTNKAGWGSGIWGSLNYWLDQQDVNRGAQPAFYYAMTLPTYEYLTMAFAAIGLFIRAWRKGLDSVILLLFSFALGGVVLPLVNDRLGNRASIPVVVAAIICAVAAMQGDRLRQFLVFYFAALLFGLSVAGEKMPWLTVHLALPLAILAGLAINDVFGGLIQFPSRVRRSASVTLLVLAFVGAGFAAVLAARALDGGVRLAVTALVVGALVLGALSLASRFRPSPGDKAVAGLWLVRLRVAGMVTAAALVGFFGILTLRNDWRMNWVHPDTPDEMLIYTQTSPDIPKLMGKIDQLAMESGEGHNLRITVDANDSFTWPWAWYLRDYPNTSYIDLSVYASNPAAAANLNPGSVLLVNTQDQAVTAGFPGKYGTGERFHHRWWFPESYKDLSAASFARWARNGSIVDTWWRYITNRDGFTVPPSGISRSKQTSALPAVVGARSAAGGDVSLGSVDAIAYFPANWVPGMGLTNGTAAAAVQNTARINGSTLVLGGPGAASGQFSHPAGIASDAAGNIYVADTLNNRIEKFDPKGTFIAQAGGQAQPGGTQFNQPWDLAIGPDGSVFVADTWNHRVVKLDGNLQQIAAWGRPTAPAGPASPLDFYGPRSIVVDRDGNVWIADTGDARLVKFDPNGNPLGSFGTRGSGPGQFDEPVGLATGPDGSIYVADTWNNRIEWFDTSGVFKGQMPVSAWVSEQAGRDAENKPYIAVLPDGSILTTYPAGDGLVQYDTRGAVLRSLSSLPGMTDKLRHPLGVALTSNGELLLSDSTAGQVIRVPLAALPALSR